MGAVVVGVDGSAHSGRALGVAAREARCRSVPLHVVYVYEPVRASDTPVSAVVAASAWTTADESAGVVRDAQRRTEEQRAAAHRNADARLRQMIDDADVDLGGLSVERIATSGHHPAGVLVDVSADADLLVVGSRGVGGFRGVLLGSVGQQCVHHARCDVLVVRAPREGGRR